MILCGMVMRGSGLTEKSPQGKPVFGFTDTETVKLDFDDASFKTVKYFAVRALKWFKLGGFVILKSSLNCYHVVFNRKVSWSENMSIVAWVSLVSRHERLKQWFLMQCIKQSSTLRVSSKGMNPSPRIVCRYDEQLGQVQGFLAYRKMIKKILRRLTNG